MDPSKSRTDDVTRLLADLQAGNAEAEEQLIRVVYAELHDMASRQMRRERPDHTLQPTLLVNEAFMRLVAARDYNWQSRAQFLGVAAQAMRRILVDHARRRRSQKRGAGEQRVPLDPELAAAETLDVEDLHEALNRLAQLDPRQARIVELRYFAGLNIDEIAELLGVARSTVNRDWRFAKAWLKAELM